MVSKNSRVSIIGCGAWGITIAELLSANQHEVLVWCHSEDIAQTINDQHKVKNLDNQTVSESILATHNFEETCMFSDVIVIALASSFISILEVSVDKFQDNTKFLVLTKGFLPDQDSELILVSDYISSVFKHRPSITTAVLSGPNLAGEIYEKLPAATVVASNNEETATLFQSLLTNESFRVYTSSDVQGVSLGGILKNIMAIAAGIIDGLGLGYNAKSAFLTRALLEMIRFGEVMGAQRDTFYGLSGLGDLMATCHSPSSRNYRVGVALAKEGDLDKAVQSLGGAVAEGVKTTQLVYDYVQKQSLEMPIVFEIYSILYEKKALPDAIKALMKRELKSE